MRDQGVAGKWDAHDLLKFAFETNFMPESAYNSADESGVVATTSEDMRHRFPDLYLRVYTAGSSAACETKADGTLRPSVQVALSVATVFDECKEYAPWSCDRPKLYVYTYVSLAICALYLGSHVYRVFCVSAAKGARTTDGRQQLAFRHRRGVCCD